MTKIKSVEHSGGNVNYYLAEIKRPKRKEFAPYIAECEDIITALGMNFAEGTNFKALWRSCAQRTLGLAKRDGDAVYDAEKMVMYSGIILDQRLALRDIASETLARKDEEVAASRADDLKVEELDVEDFETLGSVEVCALEIP